MRSRPEAVLLLVAAVLIFGRLHLPLLEPEEARYAEIPRQMLAAGAVLVPVHRGEPYLDKPPLLYWAVMASYQVFGVTDWAARLPTAACAWLTVVVAGLWGRAVAGRPGGVAAAGVLTLTPDFMYRGPMLTMNGPLALCVAAALAAGHAAVLGGRFRRRWWVASAAACAAGVLVKGPVGVVLVVPSLFVVRWLDRSTVRPSAAAWAGYAAVVLVLAGPWFLAMSVSVPGFAEYFFWRHHVERYVRPFDHAKPAWAYLPQLALGTLPWTLAAGVAWVRRPAGVRVPAAALVGLAAAAWGLAFFSAAGSKRPAYLLPVEPPLALALGVCLAAAGVLGPNPVVPRAGRGTLALAGLTLAVLLAGVFGWLPAYTDRFAVAEVVAAVPADARGPGVPVATVGHDWDSVGFYLDRDDVHTLSEVDCDGLTRLLDGHDRVLVFVAADHRGEGVVAALPPTLRWQPLAANRLVVAGLVTRVPAGGSP